MDLLNKLRRHIYPWSDRITKKIVTKKIVTSPSGNFFQIFGHKYTPGRVSSYIVRSDDTQSYGDGVK